MSNDRAMAGALVVSGSSAGEAKVWLIYTDTQDTARQISKLGIQACDKVMIASSTGVAETPFMGHAEPMILDTDDNDDEIMSNVYTGLPTPPLHTPVRGSSPVTDVEPDGYGYYCMGDPYDVQEIGLPTLHRRLKRTRQESSSDNICNDYDDDDYNDHLGPTTRPRKLPTIGKLGSSAFASAFASASESTAGAQGPFCYRVKCEVTCQNSVTLAMEKCIETFGKVDVVVASCGFQAFGEIEEKKSSSQLSLLLAGQAILCCFGSTIITQYKFSGIGAPKEFVSLGSQSHFNGSNDPSCTTIIENMIIRLQSLRCRFTRLEMCES